MKKLVLAMFLTLASLVPANSEPVARTTLDEALRLAPAAVLVEAGKQQYDDLKEGEEVKTESLAFDSRKQTFKILKVYRNKTALKLKEGMEIEVNRKSNGCINYSISVKKLNGKLEITNITEKQRSHFDSVEVKNTHEKEILFLAPNEADPKLFEHYGWFVSPQKYSDELNAKLSSAAK